MEDKIEQLRVIASLLRNSQHGLCPNDLAAVGQLIESVLDAQTSQEEQTRLLSAIGELSHRVP
jgi:hypothetical protein